MVTPLYKIRVVFIFLLLCCAYSTIIMKLYYVQVRHAHYFASLGNRQYSVRHTQALERALIYDRHHNPLVINVSHPSACITPRQLQDTTRMIQLLEDNFPAAARRLHEQPDTGYLYIQRHLTEEERLRLEEAHIPDIFFINEPGRFYTVPSLGPLIGITNADNEGAFGIERVYNTQLQGSATEYTVKRDARNRQQLYFEKQVNQVGASGEPLTLTIDSNLQAIAYEELRSSIGKFNAREGAVIIMDAATGEILACASYPDFDPNHTRSLCIDHTKNRVFAETYEFGSIIKVFLALAALAEKIVTPDTLIDCHNTQHIVLHSMRINNWRADGTIPFSEVIMRSNNIGTAQVAYLLQERLYTHYRACGFGTKAGLLPEEQAGYITPPHTWTPQSYASLSYGYEISATLLQLACGFCMIARNGIPVHPSIIRDELPPLQPTEPIYSADVIDQIHQMLTQTITHGTAYKAHIAGYHIMGKTGTANILEDGVYQPNKNLFTFAGIILQGEYKRVIATFIKEINVPGPQLYASAVSAPLFERIAERMLIQEKITPRLSINSMG